MRVLGGAWDLKAEFLRSFDAFENLLVEVIASLLGPDIAEAIGLLDTVALLEELGIVRSADRTAWATCLAVRRRLLLSDDLPSPQEHELNHSLEIMTELQATIASRSQDQADSIP